MRKACGAVLLGAVLIAAVSAGESQPLEQRFDAQLKASDLQDWMQRLSSAPNQVGAPHDKANAEYIQQLFRSWGWDAKIETFEVLYPTLKEHRLELLGPAPFVASLNEPAIAADSTSNNAGMDAYTIYGSDGDVTAELVYVNYGMPDDYLELQRRNIDVAGKIVIARYGQGWRGLKPKLAQQHGAVGCIIYSDPADDGYAVGDSYPAGGSRPEAGLQRGSVLDIVVATGDPLTPGWGSTQSARRLPLAEASTILRIPTIPVSYGDAQPLLAALSGPVAPPAWRGALPLTYHIGGGSAKVHMRVQSDWGQKPVYDVIAKLRGTEYPDEWVVRGNHHDAWVLGAWDPLSGQVAMLAEAKALGALFKQGWRPKRTLVYASWDGEEPGLLGSTEWAEAHADELQRKVVLYANSDTNSRGFLSASGSSSLQRLVNEIAADVNDPQTGVSVKARADARSLVAGTAANANSAVKDAATRAKAGGEFGIRAPGSGSDYTVFAHHLGITTLDLAYGGEADLAGLYHSSYDSYDAYVRLGDPGFVYGIAEAQTMGRVMLRFVDAAILPLHFDSVATAVSMQLKELHELVDNKRQQTAALAEVLDRNAFALAADPTRRVGAPVRNVPVPTVDFGLLDAAAERLRKSAAAYDAATAALASSQRTLTVTQRQRLNGLLRGLEQTLLNPAGLPARPWYRNTAYAPGMLTGYDPKTLPAVREAIEGNAWSELPADMALTAAALDRYCAQLDAATALLAGSSK